MLQIHYLRVLNLSDQIDTLDTDVGHLEHTEGPFWYQASNTNSSKKFKSICPRS